LGRTFSFGRFFGVGGAALWGHGAGMKGFPDLPPLWLALFLVLNWVVASALGGWQSALLTGMSWVFIGLGLAVIGWSALWFWRRKTTIEPHHAPGALIVEGPFRWSRNPIYLALLLILLGAVIGRGQPLCLIWVALFYWVLTARFVRPEEAALRDAFGASAQAYFDETRRWI